MSRNRSQDPNPSYPHQPPQPTQGNQVYGTSPQQVSPNTPNSSQTVSPVIIYAYPPHMDMSAPQAPQYAAPPQYAQQPQAPQPPHQSGCGYQRGGCGHDHGGCKRKPRKRRFLKFLFFVGIIWLTAVVTHKVGGKIVHMMKFRKIAKEMDLSHHQRHQLRNIFWEAVHKNGKHRGKMLKMRNEFMLLMAKPNLTQKELDAFLQKSTNEIQQIVLGNSGLLFKARNVLTPGQRHILMARLRQLQRRRHRRWHRRWHRHHGHRGHHGDIRYGAIEGNAAPKAVKATNAAKKPAARPANKATQAAKPAPIKPIAAKPAPALAP